ncbi:MAG: hypothetical protein K2M93_08090 [Muribaculaceae bacterium]|nr:hypothetical protein [Muribaculaceae bacterium]
MQFVTEQIEICRCERREYDKFESLHYLKGICSGASCFMFKINGVIGAFASLLSMPMKGRGNALIFHRIVVLRQFQGLGLSSMIVNLLGGIFKAEGKDIYLKTDSTRMGKMLRNNIQWSPTIMNRRTRKLSKHDHERNKARHRRAAFSFKYIGIEIRGYEALAKHIREVRDGNLLGKYVPVNIAEIAKSTYRINELAFFRDSLTNCFDVLSEKYGANFLECSQPAKLFTTQFVIKRKEYKGASREYLKRLLFINAMIRMIQHKSTIESLIFHLLKENHQQQFNLSSVEVAKMALKAYNTDISKYSLLAKRIKSYSSYSVNVEAAKEMGINTKAASNIARKQIRAQKIAEIYRPDLSDIENIRLMAANGLKISISTLKRWRKDQGYSKYNKSVIPIA